MNDSEKEKTSGFKPSTLEETSLINDLKTVWFTNQNQYLTLRRWYYSPGNYWQSKGCPVGKTCNDPDINVCHKNPATAIDIGVMPCGGNYTLFAVFFDSRTNQERNFRIDNTSVDCSQPAKYIHLAPEH